MRILKKEVNSIKYDVLDIDIIDNSDMQEVLNNYTNFNVIQISLSQLEYLKMFNSINVLIITSGLATYQGMEVLYSCTIHTLVLDYEETDSDDDGIELEKFSNLRYVLSRSDLNIKQYHKAKNLKINIDILNYYGLNNGKPIIKYEPNYTMLKPKYLFFFSIEAKSQVSTQIIEILKPIEKYLNTKDNVQYSANLDSIGIIPICMPQDMLKENFGKERKYISLKKREVDIRIQINYNEFLLADKSGKIDLCKECLIKSAQIIGNKDLSFNVNYFCKAVCVAAGYMTGAISGFVSGGLTNKSCFVVGTVVLTLAGYVSLENNKKSTKFITINVIYYKWE